MGNLKWQQLKCDLDQGLNQLQVLFYKAYASRGSILILIYKHFDWLFISQASSEGICNIIIV